MRDKPHMDITETSILGSGDSWIKYQSIRSTLGPFCFLLFSCSNALIVPPLTPIQGLGTYLGPATQVSALDPPKTLAKPSLSGWCPVNMSRSSNC